MSNRDITPIPPHSHTVYPGESIDMSKNFLVLLCASLLLTGLFSGCWGGGSSQPEILVNSLQDMADPPEGTVTIRDAIERIESGGKIIFDESLNGEVIDLTIVGEEHSTLRGEVFNPGFLGYQERDYGASALYARKNLTIDASDLPEGITLNWTGGDVDTARVLAVYGDLTMRNITITNGYARAETIIGGSQPYTLGRGGGLAVWGVARLYDCTIGANRAEGDLAGGRDRGAFGGGIYGDVLILEDCVIAGNSASGYGAAGGGVHSVGGWDSGQTSSLTRCAVTGNLTMGQHAYGGGVYSDGGGRGNRKPITLTSCTLARNTVMDHPGFAENPFAQYYYRGGGFYMSNGYLWLNGCTIAENTVSGVATTFNGKPNMGGGGVAATIGDAHVVEDMRIRQSIIAGNTLNGLAQDLFTGSLIYFKSWGYNLIGDLNFDYIHVPVPWWSLYLSRKHYPKEGDQDNIQIADVLSLDSIQYHPTIVSVGVSAGQNVVLSYPPAGDALDAIPAAGYMVTYIETGFATQTPFGESADFLGNVLDEVNTQYGLNYSAVFVSPDPSTITFYGPAVTWPGESANEEWITFWNDLDSAIGDSLGTEKLADDFWEQFPESDNGRTVMRKGNSSVSLIATDQLGNLRPAAGGMGDIGAIETP